MCNKIIATKVARVSVKEQVVAVNIYGEYAPYTVHRECYIPVGEVRCHCKCLINIKIVEPLSLFDLL